MPVHSEDLKQVEFIRFQRLNGVASGVVDTIEADQALTRVYHGTLNSSGIKARLYGSDTVSGTASGMDFIASAGTNLAASGTSWCHLSDKPPRFLGLVLSGAGAASAGTYPTAGALCDLRVNKTIPGDPKLGFTALTYDPSDS